MRFDRALQCMCRFFLKEGVIHAMEQLASSLPAEEVADQPKGKSPAQGPAPAPRPPSRRSSSRLKVGGLYLRQPCWSSIELLSDTARS